MERTVQLTLNGQDPMNVTLPFTFYDPLAFVIHRVHPMGGPAAGGTLLTIYLVDDRLLIDKGGGFRHGLRCRFIGGENETRHRVDVSANITDCSRRRACGAGGMAIACVMPPWPGILNGRHVPVVVEVTLNGQQFSNSGTVPDLSLLPRPWARFMPAGNTLNYYDPSATRIEAVAPFVGPTAGNTSIMIQGFALAAFGDLRCRFGSLNEETNATLTSDSAVQTIRCASPPHWAHPIRIRSVSVKVEVTLNGQHYLQLSPVRLSSPSLEFTYISLDSRLGLSVEAISPRGGPAEGHTRVTVAGSGFDKRTASSPECRFGNATVNASILTSEVLLCDSPSLIAASNLSTGSTMVNLSVGINGQVRDFTSPTSFVYHELLIISRAFPYGGSARGGTPLTVFGRGFEDLDAGSGLRCIFGNRRGNVSVPAFVNPSTNSSLECISPSLDDIEQAQQYGFAAVSSETDLLDVEVRVTNNRLGGWRMSQASSSSVRFIYK